MTETALLVTLLKGAIEVWAETLRENSALSQVVRSGGMTQAAIAYYLVNERLMFREAEANLKRAGERAEQMGQSALSAFFAARTREGNGHEAWASRELAKLAGAGAEFEAGPAMRDLVALQESLIARHPVLFAVYVLWAEYFTALLGDEWLDALSGCGLPSNQISAIAKRIETSREQAAQAFDQLEQLWTGTPAAGALVEVVAHAGSLFERFADEVYEHTRHGA